MRLRRRYVVFEIVDGNLNIRQTLAWLCEELQADHREIRTVIYDENLGKGILFCSHRLLDELREKIAERGVPMKIIGVSGTMRAAKRKFFGPEGEGGVAGSCR
ncbi:MAG: hypothetical protein QW835_07395 [Candidatus Hadarchaeum sp.]|uniref:hypothetical protein n=1 Tax=Candidatus Hadarchaeum sp. TaxID=2883567 RepID=UPI0031798114